MKRVLALLIIGTILSGAAAFVATAKTNAIGTPSISKKH